MFTTTYYVCLLLRNWITIRSAIRLICCKRSWMLLYTLCGEDVQIDVF